MCEYDGEWRERASLPTACHSPASADGSNVPRISVWHLRKHATQLPRDGSECDEAVVRADVCGDGDIRLAQRAMRHTEAIRPRRTHL
jgi:hypothetical protein